MKTFTANEAGAIVMMALSLFLPIIISFVDVAAPRSFDDYVGLPYGEYKDILDCSGPDLVISSVRMNTSDGAGSKRLTVAVKNIGNAPAVMNYPKIAGWQAFLSPDGVTKDVRIHGKNFTGTLCSGQTASASTVIPAHLVKKPHFLIVELFVLSTVGECNTRNNTFVYSSRQQ